MINFSFGRAKVAGNVINRGLIDPMGGKGLSGGV